MPENQNITNISEFSIYVGSMRAKIIEKALLAKKLPIESECYTAAGVTYAKVNGEHIPLLKFKLSPNAGQVATENIEIVAAYEFL